jgi:fibro-slime domain-containing protein
MRGARVLGLVVVAISAGACAGTHGAAPDAGAGSGGATGSGATGAGGNAGALVLQAIPDNGYSVPLPNEFGGYQLGVEIPAGAVTGILSAQSSTGCQKLRGIVRDFRGALPAAGGSLEPGGHPDFEVFEGRGVTTGLVAAALGDDGKPRYQSVCELGVPVSSACPFGAMTTSAANFKQWYSSFVGVNKTYYVYFELVPPAPVANVLTFSSSHFFPLGGLGWGYSGLDGDMKTPRNYSFTTEIHTKFLYRGGETFTFNGDDDVWIFINGKLAVDLGGLHFTATGSVNLDASATTLDIQKGSAYALDLFHAERHSVNSDFRIDMSFFEFQDCGYIIP